MRKRALPALVAVVGLLMVMAVPAGAAKAEPYKAVECYTGNPLAEPAHFWFTGKNDAVMHLRGGINTSDVYIYDAGNWTFSGTNEIVLNWNLNKNGMSMWGDFFMDIGLGEFDGSWAWGRSAYGHATGKGVGDSAGMHAKVVLMGDQLPADWPAFDGCDDLEIGFFSLTVR